MSASSRRCKRYLSTVGLLAALPACTALPRSAVAGLLWDWSCVAMGLQAVTGDDSDDRALTTLWTRWTTTCGLQWRRGAAAR